MTSSFRLRAISVLFRNLLKSELVWIDPAPGGDIPVRIPSLTASSLFPPKRGEGERVRKMQRVITKKDPCSKQGSFGFPALRSRVCHIRYPLFLFLMDEEILRSVRMGSEDRHHRGQFLGP
jgi:hypothetical protein